MPERSAPDAALRFVRDLKSLRESRGVSLDSLHAATRVPADVLEAFEATVLSENRLFNRVYLRSLVRAYAGSIGYDVDRAVLALEEALAGQYDGALLREPEPEPEDEGLPEEENLPERAEGPPAPEEEFRDEEGREEEPLAEQMDEQALPPAPLAPPVSFEPPAAPGQIAPEQAPPVVAWDAVSGSTTRGPQVRQPETPWAGILGGLGLIALLIALAIWWWTRTPEAPAEATAAAPADTTDQQVAASAPPQTVTLPDTLVLRVTAARGPVSDIKIQRDDDVRRPYWIEVGESQDFPFTTRITVERELEDAAILVQGVPYPASRADADGRLVIVRDTVLRLLQQR